MNSRVVIGLAALMLAGFVATAAALMKAHELSHENTATNADLVGSAAETLADPLDPNSGDSRLVTTGLSNSTDTTLNGEGDPPGSSDQKSLSEEIEMLRQSLAQQQQTILDLSREIASLKEAPPTISTADTAADVIAAVASEESVDSPTTANSGSAQPRRGNASPPREALVLSGVDPGIADDIKQRLDARALADLQIRDQAAREGWLDAPDFRERRDALLPERVSVRDELGTDTFDRYLYNRGRNNRVVVSSVMSGSAAQIAGFLPGDMIYSYAGSQVFSMRELTRATRAGEAGAPTEVQVIRDGSSFILDVPRGPLGVTMAATRVDPETTIE